MKRIVVQMVRKCLDTSGKDGRYDVVVEVRRNGVCSLRKQWFSTPG